MIPLKSSTAVIKINQIDEHIFSERYFARCMECSLCNDNCCSYGCPVDIAEAEKIKLYKDDIEKRTGIPAPEWFSQEAEEAKGFPSEKIVRTRVQNNKCVFHDNISRGCHLHRIALEKGFDPHSIKPMICFLFPLTWEGSCLYVSEFLDELPCKNTGMTILESQMNEMNLYLGEEFIKEVKSLQIVGMER